MATAVETYRLKSEIAFFQSSLRSPTLSKVDELCWSAIPENHSQVKKEEENFALPCLCKLHISPRSRAVKTTKCTKKYDAGENCFFFCSLRPVHTYSVETVTENASFQRRRLLVYVWTDGSRGFRVWWCHTSYTTSITHALWGCYRYFHRFSVFMWTGENDSNTLRLDAYFFWTKEGKKIRFKKYLDTHGRCLLLQAHWTY